MKKLIEGLPFYQDKLHEETVFAKFTEILTKVNAEIFLFSQVRRVDVRAYRPVQINRRISQILN